MIKLLSMTLLLSTIGWVLVELISTLSHWRSRSVADRRLVHQLTSEIRSLQDHSPGAADRTSSSPSAKSAAAAPRAKSPENKFRKFRVAQKVQECDGCHSFYFVPEDGGPLPEFLPGQFLTFSLRVPGHDKPIVRCYSLSDRYRSDRYRCTIKRVGPPANQPQQPPGVSSTFFNDVVHEGALVDIKPPSGAFHLNSSDRTIVLIAAGIGITPMISMAQTISAQNSPRPVVIFYGVRNGREHAFKEELNELHKTSPRIEVVTFYSRPDETDTLGRDYSVRGRVTAAAVKKFLSNKDAEFYLCGPGPFMEDLVEGLTEWGVASEDIRFEAFGPSTIKKKPQSTASAPVQAQVRFSRSGKVVPWDPNCDSLLDFAEQHDVEIESGCRSGNCGTCTTSLKSGCVNYSDETDFESEEGEILPCVCTPAGNIVLDL